MSPITYQLNGDKINNFYTELAVFTDKILLEANQFLKKDIELFKQFVEKENIEKDHHFDEYIVQFLSIGIFCRRYASMAAESSDFATSTLQYLYDARKKYNSVKPVIDNVRGYLSNWFLFNKSSTVPEYTGSLFTKLIKWLKATGEFKEETEKLQNWAFYFFTSEVETATVIINKAISFSIYFEEQAKLQLGKYTDNVDSFLSEMHPKYKNREDYLFCGRSESEYHLNMFGAEVLNRHLKENFDKTNKKVLLAPTCMSKPANGKCKATIEGTRIKCTACSIDCEVNKIKLEMKKSNVETYLIPHSSSFTKFLENWKDQDEVGLIGVACVLNLLSGGYEMQRLNIPSQCVFLEYAGCKKHWHPEGLPTSLNVSQLQKIVGTSKLKPAHNNFRKTVVNDEIKVA